MARPGQNGRFRPYAGRREKRRRPRERRTPVGQHRGKHHGTDHSHARTDALRRRIQQSHNQRREQPNHPIPRHRTGGARPAGHPQLHEDERGADGRRRRDPAARSQPHRNRRRGLRTNGTDEKGSARRRGNQLRIRQHEIHPRLDQRSRKHRIRSLLPGDRHHFPVPARLARDAGAVRSNPRLADRIVLRDVPGRILDQRAVDAGRGAGRRTGRRRRDCDDRKYLHPHRTRHESEGGRYRRS